MTDGKDKEPSPRGRRSQIDDEITIPRGEGRDAFVTTVRERVLDAVRGGAPLKMSAAYAGVGYRTLREWIEKGEADGAREPYLTFASQLRLAQAGARLHSLAEIRVAGKKDWRAHAWYLEKTDREEFGAEATLRHKGDREEPIALDFGDVPPEQLYTEDERTAILLMTLAEMGELPQELGRPSGCEPR